MIERIKYFKRMIYNRGYYGDVYMLARIQHPLVIETLWELVESDKISDKTREIVINSFILQDDPRGHELVIQKFQEKYQYSYNLLGKIGQLNDKRIVPTLIDTLENIHTAPRFPRNRIVSDTIKLLSDLNATEAIPILEHILETYSFISPDGILSDRPFAINALFALQKMSSPKAEAIAHIWEQRLDTHIQSHLDKGSFIKLNNKGKIRIPQYIGTRPDVIRHLLSHLNHEMDTVRYAITEYLGSKISLLDTQPELQAVVITQLIYIAEKSEDIRLRHVAYQRLVAIKDERMIAIALAGLDDPILQTKAVEILIQHEYRGAIDKVIEILLEGNFHAMSQGSYFEYLAMLATDDAEMVLSDFLDDVTNRDSNRRAFRAMAKIAHHSDTAFEAICQAVNHENAHIYDSAIASLRTVGEPALAILVSLVELCDRRVFSAVKALASIHFVDAVPHLIPLLMHPNQRLVKLVSKTLIKIGTEGAFAALNALEDS